MLSIQCNEHVNDDSLNVCVRIDGILTSATLQPMLSLQGANILLTERGDVKLGQFLALHVDTQTHDNTPTLHCCFS